MGKAFSQRGRHRKRPRGQTAGHFVTGPKTPYELRWRSPMVAEMNVIQIHLAGDQYIAAVKRVHQEEPSAIEVIDFYGRDETLAHLSFACAEMLAAQTPGDSKRGFSGIPRIYVAENYPAIWVIEIGASQKHRQIPVPCGEKLLGECPSLGRVVAACGWEGPYWIPDKRPDWH